ncbi:MAG: hypothetical protein ABEJ95_01355 [Candidatus Nanohalobium sp.]
MKYKKAAKTTSIPLLITTLISGVAAQITDSGPRGGLQILSGLTEIIAFINPFFVAEIDSLQSFLFLIIVPIIMMYYFIRYILDTGLNMIESGDHTLGGRSISERGQKTSKAVSALSSIGVVAYYGNIFQIIWAYIGLAIGTTFIWWLGKSRREFQGGTLTGKAGGWAKNNAPEMDTDWGNKVKNVTANAINQLQAAREETTTIRQEEKQTEELLRDGDISDSEKELEDIIQKTENTKELIKGAETEIKKVENSTETELENVEREEREVIDKLEELVDQAKRTLNQDNEDDFKRGFEGLLSKIQENRGVIESEIKLIELRHDIIDDIELIEEAVSELEDIEEKIEEEIEEEAEIDRKAEEIAANIADKRELEEAEEEGEQISQIKKQLKKSLKAKKRIEKELELDIQELKRDEQEVEQEIERIRNFIEFSSQINRKLNGNNWYSNEDLAPWYNFVDQLKDIDEKLKEEENMFSQALSRFKNLFG